MKLRIGIDLGGTKTELLAMDSEGRELYRERRPTPGKSYEEILKNLNSRIPKKISQKFSYIKKFSNEITAIKLWSASYWHHDVVACFYRAFDCSI